MERIAMSQEERAKLQKEYIDRVLAPIYA